VETCDTMLLSGLYNICMYKIVGSYYIWNMQESLWLVLTEK